VWRLQLTSNMGAFPNEILRHPFYFGSDIGPLLGWHHEAASGRRGNLGVVVCPPVGHEYVHTHRSMRHLADACAAAGIPALRFDYHGVGDSAGVDEDAGRLQAWTNSIRRAIAVMKNDLGCERVGLVGLRLGATMAAMVASEQDVACLVLWAPCVKGRNYVRELKTLHLNAFPDADLAAPGLDIEAAGFVFSDETLHALSSVNIETAMPRAPRVLIVLRDDLPDDASLYEGWFAPERRVESMRMSGYADMLREPHHTRVPRETIADVVAWMSADVRASDPRARAAACYDTDASMEYQGVVLREKVLQFGPGGHLFGVLSEPRDASTASRPFVILANSGSVHHVGTNRLYTLVARALTKDGWRCLRMDLSGLGDSAIEEEERENDPYRSTTILDIACAMQALKLEYGAESFVIGGLCSGAYAAFQSGLALREEPIVECLLINPLAFYWKEGMSLDVSPTRHYKHWSWYMGSARKLDRWRKLLRGEVDLGKIARVVVERVTLLVAIKMQRLRAVLAPGADKAAERDDLNRDIGMLVNAGRRVSFFFADGDPGIDLLLTNAGRTVKRFTAKKKLSIDIIAEADHTFTQRERRDELIRRVSEHLGERD
jgi:alpha/beta superfamily hydrolase